MGFNPLPLAEGLGCIGLLLVCYPTNKTFTRVSEETRIYAQRQLIVNFENLISIKLWCLTLACTMRHGGNEHKITRQYKLLSPAPPGCGHQLLHQPERLDHHLPRGRRVRGRHHPHLGRPRGGRQHLPHGTYLAEDPHKPLPEAPQVVSCIHTTITGITRNRGVTL